MLGPGIRSPEMGCVGWTPRVSRAMLTAAGTAAWGVIRILTVTIVGNDDLGFAGVRTHDQG
jgi:hypothetical protein